MALLPLLAIAGVAVDTTPAWAGDGSCRTAWCKPGGLDAPAQAIIAEQLDRLTRWRDCWVPADAKPADIIPSELLVRGAALGDGSGVVRVVTLDQGWALAESGDVYVVGGCR